MDTTLKQRILGIIVLVALLGICLSVLLHHNKNQQHSKMPAISKTATTTPAIVNTTSSLLNSNNSANMTPADTNVFDNDIPASSNDSTTPNAPTATPSNTTISTSQAQPQLQQQSTATTQPTPATSQTPTQSPAAYNATASQSPAQPTVNNAVSPETVATSTIKPITPPTNSTTSQDMTAQISATTTNATAATTNTDDAYTSLPNNINRSPATAIPTNNINMVAHKTSPHAHAKTAKIAVAHKKTTTIQHTTIVNNTPHAATSNTQEVGTDFVLQVGSFNLPANAETLADKLRAKGFVTSIQKSHTAQGDMTRVVVGKNGLDRTQVETLRHQLQTEMQIQGFVVPQNTSTHTTTTNATAHNRTSPNKHASASSSTTNANDEI